MNFRKVVECVNLCVASKVTPCIVGEAGIGKTALAQYVADIQQKHLIVIEGNLLKEGEIGGLPNVYTDANGVTMTNYAIHPKIRELYVTLNQQKELDAVEAKEAELKLAGAEGTEEWKELQNKKSKLDWSIPRKGIILFIDEINRTTRETMSELMNVILNRNVNGFKIDKDRVGIICAMNPSSTTEGYSSDQYGVTEMDGASKNRLVWLDMDTDSNSWLDWANSTPKAAATSNNKNITNMYTFNKLDFDTCIDDSIIEFLSSQPDMLNVVREDIDARPSPRTWEFVSNIIRTYNKNKGNGLFTSETLDLCITGCVGTDAFIQYSRHTEDNKNPLIKPEEFWNIKMEDLTTKHPLYNKFENDTLPRKQIVADNIAKFLAKKLEKATVEAKTKGKKVKPESVITKDDITRICFIYDALEVDVCLNTIHKIIDNYSELADILLDQSEFLQLYRKGRNKSM